MTRSEARQEIRRRWREIIPELLPEAKKNTNGEASYICPFCGHGKNGDGLTFIPGSEDGAKLKCFACDWAGDIIDLYQNGTGESYTGAFNLLAAQLGINVDLYRIPQGGDQGTTKPATAAQETKGSSAGNKEQGPAEKAQETAEKTAPAAAMDFTAYYDQCRQHLTDPAAAAYLKRRGISTETAAAYYLGFDPAADPATAPGAMENEYKPHPAPRIICPTSTAHYVGRRIDDDKTFVKVNSAGGSPEIFNKPALYDTEAQAVFITEGFFNALSFLEIGAEAIATNSASNRQKLIDLVKAYPPAAPLILAFDNDDAGRKAAEETAKALKQANIAFTQAGPDLIGEAGSGEDANDLLIKDREAFKRAARKAERAAAGEADDYLTDFLDKVQSEAYKPYPTGLPFFDDLLDGGIVPQSLIILMAAPAAGKTTLAQQLAEAMAEHQRPVIYLNLEMSREQMLAKAISRRLAQADKGRKTTLNILQGYKWTPEEKAEITAEIERYRKTAYKYIRYNPTETGSDLENILNYLHTVGERAKAKREPAPAVFLDYLHLISTTQRIDNQELIKQTVTGLKKYAIDYNTFVLGISATNRTANSSGRITMESGRDSSNLEFTGDYQLSLNYYAIDCGDVKTTDLDAVAALQQKPERQMIVRVLKNRLGTVGKTKRLLFNAANNIFSEDTGEALDWDAAVII